ncbi:calcium-binding protein [Prochlorococcus sp. MIT 0701]|uniref:calcium-binding protein n=2 Tax=unclassified Prochlorococcus TaxID=2627481 RepID=UPI0039AF3DA5
MANQNYPNPNPKGNTLQSVKIDATMNSYTNNGSIIDSEIDVGIWAYNSTLEDLTNNGHIENTSINLVGTLYNNGTISGTEIDGVGFELMAALINANSGLIDGGDFVKEYSGVGGLLNHGIIKSLSIQCSDYDPSIMPKNEKDGTILGGEIKLSMGSQFQNDGTIGDFEHGETSITVGEKDNYLNNDDKFINNGTVNFNSSANWLCYGATIENYGTINLGNPDINHENASFSVLEVGTADDTISPLHHSTFYNNKGGIVENHIYTVEVLSGCQFINAGKVCNYSAFVNDGNIDTTKGTFTNLKGGVLSGTGTHEGNIINDKGGALSPGSSSGGYFIDGNLYQKEGSTKEIELGGTYHGDGDRTATEHDWIEITGDLELAGDLDVSLIDGFKLSAGDSFVIAKVDGDLAGEYDGLNEGDSVGRFKSEKGGKLDLFLTYEGGDGNDIELYTKSFFSVLPDSLRDPRIIGSDDKDSLTGTSADEVIFGGSDDDVLLGGAGDNQVTGGNGNDKLNGGLGDDTLKGDRGADDYILSSGEDVYESFSIDENDQLVVGEGVDLSFQQVGDNLLIKGIAIHTTLLDVDKDEFLAADCIDYI